jgi:agmatine deiminase
MSHPHPLPPAEWAPHAALWTAWPSAADLWGDELAPARKEVAAMVRAIAEGGEKVKLLADGPEAEKTAAFALKAAADIVPARFGDIWLRDTGPIFTGPAHAHAFQFNGWGGKYVLPHDDAVAAQLGAAAGAALSAHPFVLEGGAVDMDGEGTLLTTRQCLLNPNRNPDWTEARAEEALKAALGVTRVLWLDEGLANDHTDGHIDNLARFVAPGRVVCQAPSGRDDPNAAVLDEIARALAGMTDAAGRRLEVVRVPSPGRIEDEDEEPIPASHMNFIIGNGAVVVPTYGEGADAAVAALAALFPGRRVVGRSAKAILAGGGAFHCITQQQPA